MNGLTPDVQPGTYWAYKMSYYSRDPLRIFRVVNLNRPDSRDHIMSLVEVFREETEDPNETGFSYDKNDFLKNFVQVPKPGPERDLIKNFLHIIHANKNQPEFAAKLQEQLVNMEI